MQVFQPQPTRAGSRLSIATGLVIGLLLLALGAGLGYLALATPFSQQFAPDPRASGLRVVLGAIGWTLLIAAPAITAVAGVAWLAGVYERASTFRRTYCRRDRRALCDRLDQPARRDVAAGDCRHHPGRDVEDPGTPGGKLR